ncbi:MAG: hypothetical protein ACYDIC_16705 [Desulfobaccales bacterium]
MSNNKVDHLALNGRRLRRIKAGLDKLIRSAWDAHRRGEIYYQAASMDGGKMRNLDDLVMHLEDARKEIREYLASIK